MGTLIFLSKKHNGGYGDRLVGMSAGITIARLLGMEFQSTWEEDFMKLCEPTSALVRTFTENSLHVNAYNCKSHPILETENLQEEWNNKTIVFQANQPVEQCLWKNPHLQSLLKDTSYEQEAIQSYKEIFTKYIKLQEMLLDAYDDRYDAGIQIRCGDTYCMPHALAEQYIPESYFPEFAKQTKEYLLQQGVRGLVYVTSDARAIYNYFNVISDSRIRFLFWNREEDIHFDFYNSENKYAQILRDHICLQNCKRIVTGLRSNFGATAAYASQICEKLTIYECDFKGPLPKIHFRDFDPRTTLVTKEYRKHLL